MEEMVNGGGDAREGDGEGRPRGVEIRRELRVFPALVLAACAALILALFITRKPALSMLAVVLAALIALIAFFCVLIRRAVSRYSLLAFFVLVGGVTLFYVFFGVEPFFRGLLTNTLIALPALGAGLLFYFLNRVLEARAQFVVSVLLSAALALSSVALFFTMNLRIRPQVACMREGHDMYLASIREEAVSDGPNVLLIFMDDLGYGDISAYGNTIIDTPNIDHLAENGVVMDNFYAASPVCTPSRFSVMTGRYAVRGHLDGVLVPTVKSFRPFNPGRHLNPILLGRGVDGILPDEINVAEALGAAGYATGVFGKWHLGDYGDYLPNARGFDHFFGTYYSNDMVPYEFYRNEEKVIEHPLDQTRITRELTREIISFISDNRDRRFFVYYASPWPHDPLHASEAFQGTSRAGTFGDCMQEFDAGLGEILQALRDHGLFDDTMIIFTSDNGPWHEGSSGGLRGRKGNVLDGGQKVPFIACYAPLLPSGTRVAAPAMGIDLFPTILSLCGLPLPQDRIIDGMDLLPILRGEEDAPSHEALFHIKGGKAHSIQRGGFKYFDRLRSENTTYFYCVRRDLLFDLNIDPAESYNVRDLHPEVADDLRSRLMEFRQQLKDNPRGIMRK